MSALKNSTITNNGVSSFIPTFKNYVKTKSNFTGKNDYPNSAKDMDEDTFYNILYNFLCTDGQKYRGSIKLTQAFNCDPFGMPLYR